MTTFWVLIAGLFLLLSIKLKLDKDALTEKLGEREMNFSKAQDESEAQHNALTAVLGHIADTVLQDADKEVEHLDILPQIEPVPRLKTLLEQTSTKLRKKMSFGISPEFQAGFADLVRQLMEAVAKSEEIRARTALEDEKAALSATLHVQKTKYSLEGLKQKKRLYELYGPDFGYDGKSLQDQDFWEYTAKLFVGAQIDNFYAEMTGAEKSAPPAFVEPVYFPLKKKALPGESTFLEDLEEDDRDESDDDGYPPILWDKSSKPDEAFGNDGRGSRDEGISDHPMDALFERDDVDE